MPMLSRTAPWNASVVTSGATLPAASLFALAMTVAAPPLVLSQQATPPQTVPTYQLGMVDRGSTSRPPSPALSAGVTPFKAGDRIFSAAPDGALMVRNGKDAAARTLLPAGSYSVLVPSHDGKYLAYAMGAPGAKSYDIRIRDIQTGKDLGEVLHHARIAQAAWTHNEKGFFYSNIDSSGHRERVYYHALGRGQERDGIILTQFDHPEWSYDARVSDDGQFGVFTISHPVDSHTRVYFIDMDNSGKPNLDVPVVKLAESFDARYEFVDNAGSYFFLQTDRQAPRGRVVLANTDVTRESRWPSVIPESADSLLFTRTAGDVYVIAVYKTASGNVARVFGPPDPTVVRADIQRRIDSLRKARGNNPASQSRRDATRDPGSAFNRANAPLRLDPRSDLAIPAGASVVAINAVADDEVLFYTLRMPDGSLRSFLYNVKDSRSEPYPSAQAR